MKPRSYQKPPLPQIIEIVRGFEYFEKQDAFCNLFINKPKSTNSMLCHVSAAHMQDDVDVVKCQQPWSDRAGTTCIDDAACLKVLG
eukprot:6088418-Amphidinium_carterae.1